MTSIPFVDFTWQHQPLAEAMQHTFTDIIQRGAFILGPELVAFEEAFAAASGVKYGVGVASGTDAIALGLRACGLGSGDEVLVPANTFIASVIGIIRAGAKPILVDCDPETALIDLNLAAQQITPKTKAILPVHLYGQLVPPQPLLDLAQNHNLLIFEDAAQAHLAHREGSIAGSLGIAAAYSFYPSKNLGALGDGGMLVTNDQAIAEKVRSYRNYGATQKYIHTERGTNSRLDNLQGAILQLKLPHLEGWNRSRNQGAQMYDHELAPLGAKGITPILNQSGSGHIYHLYVIRIHPQCPLSRDEVQKQLGDRGIQTGIHYPIPCHLQPAYTHLGYQQGDFPQAEMLAAQILSLPMFPGITEAQVSTVSNTLKAIIP